ASPVVDAAGTVYWNGGGGLYAMNPDGTVKWWDYYGMNPTGLEPSLAIGPGVLYLADAGNGTPPRFSIVKSPSTPALSISKTHSGSFIQGQNAATYTVTVSNAAGAGPTSGTVTVTETVPTGLTLMSMSGTGWTCPGTAANNCTRTNSLAGGASYPAI